MTAAEVTDFYDVEIQRADSLPTGPRNKGLYYHLGIGEAEVDQWDDGRPRLDIRTEVVTGECAGKFGPRHTFSLGGYTGVRGNGRAFEISADEQAEALVKFVKTVHPERIAFSKPVGKASDGQYTGLDEETLDEIAKALPDSEFIAKVRIDKKGYMRMSDVRAMNDPPEGFEPETDSQPFRL